MRIVFHAPYNHVWPSRAATSYPAGYVGTVRRIVGNSAIAKGRATELRGRDNLTRDERFPDCGRRDRVAGANLHDDVGYALRGDVERAGQ